MLVCVPAWGSHSAQKDLLVGSNWAKNLGKSTARARTLCATVQQAAHCGAAAIQMLLNHVPKTTRGGAEWLCKK